MMLITLLMAFMALPAPVDAPPKSHCTGSEVAIFYCGIGEKNLSVCRLDDGRVSYRFGRPGEPELAIDSIARVSSRGYPGGGETRLRFSRDGHDYFVYDLIRYSGFIDEEKGLRSFEDHAGVHIARSGKRVATLRCTDFSDAGSGKVSTSKLTSRQEEDFIDLD